MPFMDELNKLRMNNIYNDPSGGNPFTPSRYDPNEQALSFIDQMRLRNFGDTINPQTAAGFARIGQSSPIQDSAGVTKPMNTIFKEDISPLDRAKLDIARKSLQSKGDIAEANRQSREEIASGSQDIQKQKADISQQRANVYDFKSRNPGLRFERNKITGELNAIDPISGKIMNNFGPMQMGEEELANMNQEHKLGQIAATGEETRKTEETRQTGRESLEEMKARHALELANYNAGQQSKSINLPSQQAKNVENKYNILINKRPDLRKFVTLDANRNPVISDNASDEDRQYINKFLFPGGKDTVLPNESTDKTIPKPSDTKSTSKPKILSITPIGGK